MREFKNRKLNLLKNQIINVLKHKDMRGLVQLFLVQNTSDGTFQHQDIAKIKVTSEIWTKGDLQRCDDNLTKEKRKNMEMTLWVTPTHYGSNE
jgi:hypothetical protein